VLALKKKSASFSSTDVQSYVLFAFTHATCIQPLSPLTNSFDVLRYACPRVNDALHQVAGVVDMSCLFLHQSPNSVVNRVSRSTGLFGGQRSGDIKSGVSS